MPAAASLRAGASGRAIGAAPERGRRRPRPGLDPNAQYSVRGQSTFARGEKKMPRERGANDPPLRRRGGGGEADGLNIKPAKMPSVTRMRPTRRASFVKLWPRSGEFVPQIHQTP